MQVIRPSLSSDHSNDKELLQVGESFSVLLRLLRQCSNWDELVQADASLSDALARLTEHEFSRGMMGFGVHTENTVERLAGMLIISEMCIPDVVSIGDGDVTMTVGGSGESTVSGSVMVSSVKSETSEQILAPSCTDVKVDEMNKLRDDSRWIHIDFADDRVKYCDTSSSDRNTQQEMVSADLNKDLASIKEATVADIKLISTYSDQSLKDYSLRQSKTTSSPSLIPERKPTKEITSTEEG